MQGLSLGIQESSVCAGFAWQKFWRRGGNSADGRNPPQEAWGPDEKSCTGSETSTIWKEHHALRETDSWYKIKMQRWTSWMAAGNLKIHGGGTLSALLHIQRQSYQNASLRRESQLISHSNLRGTRGWEAQSTGSNQWLLDYDIKPALSRKGAPEMRS